MTRLSAHRRAALLALLALALTAPVAAAQRTPDSPETATPASSHPSRKFATSQRAMVSTASPLASQAALDMLKQGGSATDAAIAAQLVLGLVEPQSSGLGGGAFIVHWDQAAQHLATYDGRETAPASAKPDRFVRSGKPMPFNTAVQSGLSIGVPGVVRLMHETHKKHGKLPWRELFKPAIRLARDGFQVSTRLNYLLRWVGPTVFDDNARRYFFPSGRARAAGTTLANPEYAATLERLADGGADAFYAGPIAEAVVAAAARAPNFPGDLTLADLAAYAIKQREPVCFPYRGYKVCGMGPPSSGGMAIAQTLKLLEPFDIGRGPKQAMRGQALHLIAEAEKLAYADRARYLADPAFVSVPTGLLDDAYLAERRRLIDPKRAMAAPKPGEPPGLARRAFGIDATLERAGTSHLSIVDQDGNAVAMTTTIEGAFGSGVFAAGFLLNNELTDFSFAPADAAGTAVANRVEGGKRPRSSMSPTIVFAPDGSVFAALGSPGGNRIIFYVVKSLIALIDWDYDAYAAAALVNFGGSDAKFEIETSFGATGPVLSLIGYGHNVDFGLLNSGTHIVARRNGRLEGGADPRREGSALGL